MNVMWVCSSCPSSLVGLTQSAHESCPVSASDSSSVSFGSSSLCGSASQRPLVQKLLKRRKWSTCLAQRVPTQKYTLTVKVVSTSRATSSYTKTTSTLKVVRMSRTNAMCGPLSALNPVQAMCGPLSALNPVFAMCGPLPALNPVHAMCGPLSALNPVHAVCGPLSALNPVHAMCGPLSALNPVHAMGGGGGVCACLCLCVSQGFCLC